MNFHLLIILVVIASSLLTLSQRANAQEESKQRWVPVASQMVCEAAIPDLDVDPVDDSYIALYLSLNTLTKKQQKLLSFYRHPITSSPADRIKPRAPPVFLI
ncbi:hypothetical protein [Marinomonas pollencensis]|uniref:Uncharacterized protein n=1 Tax=Marinomonas pollencensis TaxID=491954 RepID=A0A3E0DRH5_9GAMM|nr:hypothetical protein [Marinomonas pollencensis]REG85711.1 hypothetical protein DFP81_102244 [Marinomonas pollencensis]